ncbi:MAG: F0F1 ATP synthase subunit B [Bifidobacteriaceae bacterium]|jgi:F-type H+-transporting ATPase subunit b|nr:F0F1 ATP synthase subunit B [Bifidobacteriaceae bacterium]
MMWLAEGAPKGIGLFVPPWDEVIISAICLAVIAWAVGVYGVPRYLAVLDERAAVIEGGIQRAEAAEAEIASIRAGLGAEKEAARIEAAKLRDEAKADAAAIQAAAKAAASDEARRVQEAAQRQIASERQAAEVSLRQDIGALATELAERIVGESMKDSALAGRVIDRFLADLDAQARAEAGKGA